MDSKILSAKGICKNFGAVHALKNVSFDMEPAQIHCLVGENGSGKSTFVKVVAGVYTPDAGLLTLNGHDYPQGCTVREAIREGIQVIYQDLSLFPHMSVAENIAANSIAAQREGIVRWNKIQEMAAVQLQRIGVSLDLNTKVENISIANRQLVAICRALCQDAKIIFMDEPTTALTRKEINQLISIVLDLKKEGISVVFISHKLDEVMEVADQIAIFRDGEKVGDFPSREINETKLIRYMTGKEYIYTRYERNRTEETPVIKADNLGRKGNYKGIQFEVRPGDILGVTGLLGSGRTEMALSLFGLNPYDEGTLLIEGKKQNFHSSTRAIRAGISLVPENRQTQGCYMSRNITDNVSSTILDKVKNKIGFLNRHLMIEKAEKTINSLNVVTENANTILQNLSGGNAQKVVLGRWIATSPKVLILDSPTVGVDIGAKAEIYEKIQRLADEGMAIILISDELQEILANCNRLLIMRNGNEVALLGENELQQKDIAETIYNLMYSEESKYEKPEESVC